jgi:long-chain acyl-CoA synthetase
VKLARVVVHAASRAAEDVRTVADLWLRAGERDAATPAFLVQRGESWSPVGWGEAAERVEELAAGFLDLGLRRGDRAAILSRTRIEWTLCDFALASIGVVSVPIYQTSSRRDCAYLLSDSGARVLACENAEQLAKTDGLADELPELEHVLAFDAAGGAATPLAEVAERGRSRLDAEPGAVAAARAAVTPDDTLTYIYTSGTTGTPKGCVISQGNFAAVVESVRRIESLFEPGDTVLLFLPLAHNFGRLVQYCGAGIGCTIAFCPEAADIPAALERVRPTLFPTVPRLFEKVYAGVRSSFDETTGAKRRLVDWSLGVGEEAAGRRAAGKPLGPGLALRARLADRLVFAKIQARLGGRLRLAVSGGAPLSRDIIEFFAACGVLILEGYGLSETTSGCTLNRPTDYRFGTVGKAIPGVEIATAPDGEIKIRGDIVFQGYHGRPDATAEVLTEDGWLLTGDVGVLDDDGFLTITDRKKEIIVTSGGKKIPPQNVENALKASGYVSQALLVGEGRPYLVALIAVDRAEAAKVARTDEQVRALVARVVDEVNSHVGPTEQIKRFALLPREFSAEEGEVTPTLKLKRRVCEQHFAVDIERLYAAPRDAARSTSGGS